MLLPPQFFFLLISDLPQKQNFAKNGEPYSIIFEQFFFCMKNMICTYPWPKEIRKKKKKQFANNFFCFALRWRLYYFIKQTGRLWSLYNFHFEKPLAQPTKWKIFFLVLNPINSQRIIGCTQPHTHCKKMWSFCEC